jgi:putative ABC transport system permease protein
MAIGAFVGLVGFSSAFEHSWMQVYSSSGTDFAVIQGTFLNTSLDQSVVGKLQAMPEVDAVSPMIYNVMDLTPEVNALAYGWVASSYEFGSLQFVAGGRFHDGRPEVVIGELLAENLKKKPGDTMVIQGTPFKVAGVYHSSSALEADAVILPLDQLQILSSLQGKVSTIHVRLKPTPAGESPEQYLKRAQGKINAAFPGLRAVPAAERASNNQLVKMAHASAIGTSSIALLIGILGIANTMAMSVFERTREIGILRAMGWKQWQVLTLIQVEAAVLGLGGGFLGVLFGWLGLKVLAALPETETIVSASVPFPLLAEAVGLAVLAGLLAGAIPAWRGARLSPVEALRHD